MQAASDKDGDDFIVVRRKYSGKLADAFGVAALGETDKEPSVDAKDIAAFESSWKRNVFELSKPGKSVSERLSLTTASFRSERQDHRQFIEHDGRIFDKHGVGKSRLGWHANKSSSQVTQQLFGRRVLVLGYRQIHGLAGNGKKLASDGGWAH